jgi:hypothetical protein
MGWAAAYRPYALRWVDIALGDDPIGVSRAANRESEGRCAASRSIDRGITC